MRVLALMLLLNASTIAYGDEIVCYSQGHRIYSGVGDDVDYVDGLFTFKEAKSDKIVFISADCIVKI